MKKCKKMVGCLLAVSLTFGGSVTPFTTAEAATKAAIKEAKAAYSKYLKNSGQVKKFRVLNVLGDNIPEILTYEDYSMCVYTYNTKDKLVEFAGSASGDCELYYNPGKKFVVFKEVEKSSEYDEPFFEEAFIYGNSEAWDQMDIIKDKADITATTVKKRDGNYLHDVDLLKYEGKVQKNGKKIAGYADLSKNGKISNAAYEKKYKQMMTGSKKVTQFFKNSSSNRKKYLQ